MSRAKWLMIGCLLLLLVFLWGGSRYFGWPRRPAPANGGPTVLYQPLSDPLSEPLSSPLSPPLIESLADQSLILLGDSGSGDARQRAVATGIATYCQTQNCVAASIAGDVIYDRGVNTVSDGQFQSKFEQPYAALDFPFLIAFGNHDYRGCTQCYLDYAEQSAKWVMPGAYYTYLLDQVQVVVIDTEAFTAEQQLWLDDTLSQQSRPRTVVIGHKPLLTYEAAYHDLRWPGQQDLLDLLCQRADLYVAGHAHVLEDVGQISENCAVQQVISGAGGASPRQMVTDDLDHFALENNGFVALEASSNQLTLSFVDTQGKLLHQRPL